MADWGSRARRMVKETRFVTHDPEELWAMVEPADGATATELGDLLTQAAKTIKEIGGDLRTHSRAVEWDGEGGEAFRTWCDHAALATLNLGDYSESAGKWLGHAADTLHEVKPQLKILRRQSATARSVLDAHAAEATGVGNHDGGPSATEVKTAKTRYANDSADAAGLMIKLAQSYTASTEQIDALEAPEFPKLPERFVPTRLRGETPVPVPAGSGGAARGTVTGGETSGRSAVVNTRSSELSSVPHTSTPHHLARVPDVPDEVPGDYTDSTNTAIDSVGTLPSAPAAEAPGVAPPSGTGGPEGGASSPTGLIRRAFEGAGTLSPSPGVGAGAGRTSYGGRSALPIVSGQSASGSARAPGLDLPTFPISGAGTGSSRTPGRGLTSPTGGNPAGDRGAGGITGGRPTSPAARRSTGAIPRGTVIGGTSNQQRPPVGRGAMTGTTSPAATPARTGQRTTAGEGAGSGPRPPAQSGGIVGGQPRQAPQRGRTAFTSGGEGLVRGANADATPLHADHTGRGGSPPAQRHADRSTRDERSRIRSNRPAEDGSGQGPGDRPVTPRATD
ncbi:hypothetical protein [Streptomyces sp. NPDC005423]|uniref:hypothetical protein n=1 Tax=Streptomyces sp. NPDC005423 TaxID=3155343 RepID=UPI0033A7C2AF